jgi:hydrogenase expression/formation protein HypD
MVYSPLDAVRIASENPLKKVVFFAIGFETTAPVNALSVIRAIQLHLNNYFVLSSQVLVPPAIHMLLGLEYSSIQGFLAPGHVCAITGYNEYISLAAKFKVPFVITGFEPADIMKGILALVKQLESRRFEVVNEYKRVVTKDGNAHAIKMVYDVFELTDQEWRGIGIIPESGLIVRKKYSGFDAEKQFNTGIVNTRESGLCIAGKILQGVSKPTDCKAFGKECLPEHPLGAPMVSLEGACSAYFRYKLS